MKILFIGGTGNISLACTREALARGHEVYHLNRGNHPGVSGVISLKADIRDPSSAQRALARMTFDVVADFIAFTPEHILTDLKLFRERNRIIREIPLKYIASYIGITPQALSRIRREIC